MGWNIFRIKKRRKIYEPEDDLQITINNIERFAPKKYLQEREMYYYNYRQIKKYLKPLFPLLTFITERAGKDEKEEIFIQDLFLKLKNFYDVNDRLSVKEAIEDNGINIKLLEIFKIFYDDTTLTRAKIGECLENIGENKINLIED